MGRKKLWPKETFKLIKIKVGIEDKKRYDALLMIKGKTIQKDLTDYIRDSIK